MKKSPCMTMLVHFRPIPLAPIASRIIARVRPQKSSGTLALEGTGVITHRFERVGKHVLRRLMVGNLVVVIEQVWW